MNINSEQLGYWYLRLNGFLTTPSFVVHPDHGNKQETEVDLLGVRFPFRAENLDKPMDDAPYFSKFTDTSLITITEIKSGRCDLNAPWKNPERMNMLRILRAVGAFTDDESEIAAKALYENGAYRGQLYTVALMCLGREQNPELAERYPQVHQVLWPEVLDFIFRRFRGYKNQKQSHSQWDECGHTLWNVAEKSKNAPEFIASIRVL